MAGGLHSITNNAHLINKIYFPREVLPLSVVGGAAFDLAIMTVTLVVVVWIQVGPPSIHILGLLPVYLVLGAWTVALTVLCMCALVAGIDMTVTNVALPFIARAPATPAARSVHLRHKHQFVRQQEQGKAHGLGLRVGR